MSDFWTDHKTGFVGGFRPESVGRTRFAIQQKERLGRTQIIKISQVVPNGTSGDSGTFGTVGYTTVITTSFGKYMKTFKAGTSGSVA